MVKKKVFCNIKYTIVSQEIMIVSQKLNDRLLDTELTINVDQTVYDPEVNESYDR